MLSPEELREYAKDERREVKDDEEAKTDSGTHVSTSRTYPRR